MAATPAGSSSSGGADSRIEFAEFRLQLLRLIEGVGKPQDAVAELFGQIVTSPTRAGVADLGPASADEIATDSFRPDICR